MRLVNSIITKIGTLALISYLAWLGWGNLRPDKPQIGAIRKDLADGVICTIVQDIRDSRGEVRQAALLHFSNDPSDYFTNSLRQAIEQAGILDLRGRTLAERMRDLLHLRHPSHSSPTTAVKCGKCLGSSGVLYGTVHTLEAYGSGAAIDVDVHLADVATGRNVFSKRYEVETSPGSSIGATGQEKARTLSWSQRLFGWLLVVLLLPIFTINFMRAMLSRKSNKSNAFVLASYTLADTLLAWLLVGGGLSSWWAVVLFILAVTAASAYNIRIMTFALTLDS